MMVRGVRPARRPTRSSCGVTGLVMTPLGAAILRSGHKRGEAVMGSGDDDLIARLAGNTPPVNPALLARPEVRAALASHDIGAVFRGAL
jgi:hypothetical protein